MMIDASSHATAQSPGKLLSWLLLWIAIAASLYYLLSAVTLPFVNTLWIGEVPVFGLLQLPKAFVKSLFHDALLRAVYLFGWSAGSASPDYGMTHLWAMVLMAVAPALMLVLLLLSIRGSGRKLHAGYVIAVIMCAVLDGVVTISFDAMSSLKLFNGSFL